MNPDLGPLLACPLTGSRLGVEAFETVGGEVESGVLTGDGGEFPIVAGIPILKTGQQEIAALLRQGRREFAFATVCAGSKYIPWLETLMKASSIGRKLRRFSKTVEARGRERWLEWAGREIERAATAQDLFTVYYRQLSGDSPEPYFYNFCRFGTPGQFVSLSFARALGPREGFVLDHSSGAGHLTWGLAEAVAPAQVVCQDVSFFSLYAAKRFVAKRQWFVCSDILPLPFRSGVFAAVFNSDAFTNFSAKRAAFAEMVRTSQPEAAILLVWLRNRNREHLYPNKPLTPEAYCGVVSEFRHRLFADLDVLRRFVNGGSPPEPTPVSQSITLSLWIEKGRGAWGDGEIGRGVVPREEVAVNPIYEKEGDHYRLRFPTHFYREEDREMKFYYPETFTLSEEQRRAMADDPWSESLTALLNTGALIGVPRGYLARN